MVTAKIFLSSKEIYNKGTKKIEKADNLIKSMLVIFIFSWIFLLQSCAIFVGGPEHGRHGFNGNRGHTEHNERHH